ncbi:histidine ammonia-lyase [Exaiptasia diaphana]|uniref:Histidine ammonia-lyase n=1 Tax=Exaiptasia diaphana TaxID=2652724 RepID=A0A913X2P9_EXADI|nr:histidine ammonia-lyase [Exaiptasia diaphana]KXJ15900.1 Histidine ammonia-lyase [Exaiptasia diaphana]
MKINVKIGEEWFVIPCTSKNRDIFWLIEEARQRHRKRGGHSTTNEKYELRSAKNGSLFDGSDFIHDVLENNEFVVVGQKGHGLHTSNVEDFVKGNHGETKYISLDGCSLTTDDLVLLGTGKYKIKLTEESKQLIKKGRALLDDIVKENKVAYGVTTGFGKFAHVSISKEDLIDLQENLISSHAIGTGKPLSLERTRMLLALRINILAKGYSGISLETLNQYIEAFNNSMLPLVPEQGTVGASGDLAPLSHLALGIMSGQGKMWSPKTGLAEANLVLKAYEMSPVKLQPKEGIALINGTQLITALGAEALERAYMICRQADVIAALTLEVLKGSTNAFDKDIQRVRPHKGQDQVAMRLRSLLHSTIYPSEIAESHRFCNRVQDAYTLRCCPQVHGIVEDTIDFVHGILTTEMNSATDNPIIFADRREIISGGNFHGEYPAKALDYLAIGVHELASISERRTERLMNPAYSELPAFLTKNGGLNSGLMMMHCTAAALVSENKVLCHPSSVDSLTTSAGQEDHVSMGGFSARKVLNVVENVEKVLAIELLSACQGIEFLRPLKTTRPLEEVYSLVRSLVKPLDKDRYMVPDVDAVLGLLRQNKVWQTVSPFIDQYKLNVGVEERGVKRLTSPSASTTCDHENEYSKRSRKMSD